MNRVQFFNSIGGIQYPRMIVDFFDHFIALKQIVEKGSDANYGARPLRRAIQSKIEDKLSEEILEGRLDSKKSVVCDYDKRSEKFKFVES